MLAVLSELSSCALVVLFLSHTVLLTLMFTMSSCSGYTKAVATEVPTHTELPTEQPAAQPHLTAPAAKARATKDALAEFYMEEGGVGFQRKIAPSGERNV
jgi:hypothetical protein